MKIIINNQIGKKIMYNSNLISNAHYGIPEPTPGPDLSIPFYVENTTGTEQTITIQTNKNSTEDVTNIEISTDRISWTLLGNPGYETPLTFSLPANSKKYVRADANFWGTDTNRTTIFGMDKIGGNIMSLLYGSNFNGTETSFPITQYSGYFRYFCLTPNLAANTSLTDSSELILPVTSLTTSAYQNMFYSCSALRTAPVILAEEAGQYAFSAMFRGCTSLESAEIPEMTLKSTYAFYQMFYSCTSLTSLKCLCDTNNNIDYTRDWLWYASSTGTFYKKAGTNWPTGTSGIPSGWTVVEV